MARRNLRNRAGLLIASFLFGAGVAGASAQDDLGVCDLVSQAVSLDGQIVTVTGTMVIGFEVVSLDDADCPMPIWLAFEESVSDPTEYALDATLLDYVASVENGTSEAFLARVTWSDVPVPPTVVLERSPGLDDLRSILLQEGGAGAGDGEAADANEARVTIRGRFDRYSPPSEHRPRPRLVRNKLTGIIGGGGPLGYGHLNAFAYQLVVERVIRAEATVGAR